MNHSSSFVCINSEDSGKLDESLRRDFKFLLLHKLCYHCSIMTSKNSCIQSILKENKLVP